MTVPMANAKIRADGASDVKAATEKMFAAINAAKPQGTRPGQQIDAPRAFVATATTRLAINALRSARARRELYVGEWLRQRAVLLLHDVFDYGHASIAAIVGKSEGSVRLLATRARRHVEQRRPRFQTTREQRDELATRFFAAAEQGALAGLEALLASDVTLTGDGGGKVPAPAHRARPQHCRTHADQLAPQRGR